MADISQNIIGNNTILFDQKFFSKASTSWFEKDYWQNQGAITGSAEGRGTTYFFQHQKVDMVLRHYKRGGLIGKIVDDHFLFNNIASTRPWVEFNLLTKLTEWDLPVPQPVAARIIKTGMIYTADIIIKRIPDSNDCFERLCSAPLEKNVWIDVGRCIRRFHDKQVFHHDLNIHNIMLNNSNIWLIDFDKCFIRKGNKWKNLNLERLLRSLRKEKNKTKDFFWQDSDWQYFIRGYNTPSFS